MQDELALRKLLGKLKAQAEHTAPAAVKATEVGALKELAAAHKLTLTPALENALLAWRHSHDF